MIVNVSSQAHKQVRGPKRSDAKILKDVTNKLHVRPANSKPTKPFTKAAATQQNKEDKSLKRPRREDTYGLSGEGLFIFGSKEMLGSLSGSVNGRPPDPIRKEPPVEMDPCPNRSETDARAGGNRGVDEIEPLREATDGAAMEIGKEKKLEAGEEAIQLESCP